MKHRSIIFIGFLLAALCLNACSSGSTSGEQGGKLIYGAECIILKDSADTFYIIEKPNSNDEEVWEGTDPSLRRQWVRAEHGEVAGRILADELNEQEFLDARVSLRLSEDGQTPCIDDIWDDEKISEAEMKDLGLPDPAPGLKE